MTDWADCYELRRDGLFTRESNRHPAKMAVGLCFRIFEHGERMGYWKKGDLILDPMAGIFTTGICGAALGYRVLGVELEKHFIELARGNIAFAEPKFHPAGSCRILQGDARMLGKLVGAADASIGSPPYLGMADGGGIAKKGYGPEGADKVGDRTYQTRTMAAAAVTSPPR